MQPTTPPPFNHSGTYTLYITANGITVQPFTKFTGPELPRGAIYLVYGYVVQHNQAFHSFEIRNLTAAHDQHYFDLDEKKRILDIYQVAIDRHPVFRFHFGDDNSLPNTRFRLYDKRVTGFTVEQGLQLAMNEILLLSTEEVEHLPRSY